jgi:hypothetical protein
MYTVRPPHAQTAIAWNLRQIGFSDITGDTVSFRIEDRCGLLRSDSFGPFVCFRVGLLRLYDSVAHDTTVQRRPARKEERFTRRLRLTETEAGKTPHSVFAALLFFLL